MKISPESFAALKRHFLGTLRLPPRAWLERTPAPAIAIVSSGYTGIIGERCLVDFGTVSSPKTDERTIRIVNYGLLPVSIAIAEAPPWLRVALHRESIAAGQATTVALWLVHDVVHETRRRGSLVLTFMEPGRPIHMERIAVHFIARPARPTGIWSFNGAPAPAEFDFGSIGDRGGSHATTYTLTAGNATAAELEVAIADLPAWLTVSIGGHQRRGPIRGRFFDRAAPFEIQLTPTSDAETFGEQQAVMLVRTNDARQAFRGFELRFRATFARRPPTTLPHRATAAPGESVQRRRFRLPAEAIIAVVFVLLVLGTWLVFTLQGRI